MSLFQTPIPMAILQIFLSILISIWQFLVQFYNQHIVATFRHAYSQPRPPTPLGSKWFWFVVIGRSLIALYLSLGDLVMLMPSSLIATRDYLLPRVIVVIIRCFGFCELIFLLLYIGFGFELHNSQSVNQWQLTAQRYLYLRWSCSG
ncbi:hypothetical protein EJ04DRAFT_516338 [Polyplosphaeria fusca]|uniref:Uncharacterized protein n=1 Tax=Polyplosphaeria fusca TaxID=682080 RepID=A0A9P4QNX9_9PLEO|nr:hypothetical protein EJ04DRAFT_516338 [Polyplosphaeria fusca]